MSCTPVLIVSVGRSGGNYLDRRLNKYFDHVSYGEYFNPFYYYEHPERRNKLKEFLSFAVEKYAFFRIHPVHLTFEFNKKYLDTIKAWDKIILYREDQLARLISMNICMYEKKWHYTEYEQPPDYNNFQFWYTQEYLEEHLNSVTEYYNSMLTGKYVILSYEEMLKGNVEPIMEYIKDDPTTFNRLRIETKKVGNVTSNRELLVPNQPCHVSGKQYILKYNGSDNKFHWY